MPKICSIILVEDHVVVRNGFKELIQTMGNFKVTAEFDNGKQLIDKIGNLTADLIIMDLTMPVMDGAAAVKWMKEHDIEIPVLILTLDTSDKTIIELYKLGIRGYLSKTCTADTLKWALEEIQRTGYYHNELLSVAMRNDQQAKARDVNADVLDKLTEREKHFLELVGDKEEYTYEQIADIMHVHRRTVDGYRESLFEKFNIKSKTGLVLFAIKHGIVKI